MHERILKSQLIILSTITFLSFFYFYFQNNLPDSYLLLSSTNSGVNFFTYFISSVLAFFGFYFGTWVIFPFIVFAPLYAFIFLKREFVLDQIIILPLLIGTMVTCDLYAPYMLGSGLKYLISSYLPLWSLYIFMIATLVAVTWLLMRERFTNLLVESFYVLKEKIISSRKRVKVTDLARVKPKLSIPQFRSKAEKQVEDKIEISMSQAKTIQQVESELEKPLVREAKRESKPGPKKMIRPVEVTSMNQRELINCISTEKQDRVNKNPDESYFRVIVERIEDKLSEFNVDAKIIHILKGPVVDTFELELGEGIRVAKVTSLSMDLSLALQGAPIRIIHPMEGKTTVGIEVPRDPREVIYLEDILDSYDFRDEKNSLALAMGKNAFGEPYVVDLTRMPHMLVAGATGAGKSVFINTLLVSLLVKMPPEKLKLILIDPKQLELALYCNLPHLVLPVVTDPNRASLSLLWAVEEMERRYSILSKLGVRSIDGFNQKVQNANPETLAKIAHLYEGREEEGYELPYFVIIIDEFADLILTKNGKSIETNICRLAAKARACGIHLVIATQRPSVDVITGLIKANFPTRVSFRVTAGQDSRTILNSTGAENLLGKGDMLYKHGVEMRRLHSAYVDEEDIGKLVDRISTSEPQFLEQALEFVENGGEMVSDFSGMGGGIASANSQDELYNQAVRVVVEHRAASASMLQRRLKVGYNRAANLIEAMEDNGVVGPQQGSKPRQVLISAVED